MQDFPKPATLKRYGLSKTAWLKLYRAQKGLCGVCGQKKPLVIDHEHVTGWAKMKPRIRRLYVRGLCCNPCNHWVLGYRVSAERHRQAADYLERYERSK